MPSLPGGARREIWTDHEGHNVARWLSVRGITAGMLKYRLAHQEASPYTIETEVGRAKLHRACYGEVICADCFASCTGTP